MAKTDTERTLQVSLVSWIKLQYPIAGKHIIMIGNEGKRSIAGHQIAKKMGLHKYASDLFIAYPSNGSPGLWLELKRENWKLVASNKKHTEGQLEFLNKMSLVGYATAMAIGFDEAVKVVKSYLS